MKTRLIIVINLIIIIIFSLIITTILLNHQKEVETWDKAISVNSISSINTYVKKYPEGIFLKSANFKLDELTWSEALLSNTEESYKNYQKFFPRGEFVVKAYDLLEEILWRKAILTMNVSLFHEYISKYPSGKFINEALKISNIYDIDGNIYKTVTIGSQIWMAENLKTTKYNDGEAIPNVTDNTTWEALAAGAYCWYDNNEATYKATYGALYNWYAVNTGKLCPTGWHVPSDSELTTLITYLGGESVAGGKLKEVGTTHWHTPNTGTTNSSGFTALPGYGRNGDGEFCDIGSYGHWWSSTEYSTDDVWSLSMQCTNSNAGIYYGIKSFGYSVRCVRD